MYDTNILLQQSEIINSAIQNYFPSNDVTIIAEPGRYYVASAFTLACRIHSIRRDVHHNTDNIMYFINDSVYGSFTGIPHDQNIVYPLPIKVR